MRTDQFDFDLPRRLIAQHPVEPRDAARLLVVEDPLTDAAVTDLPQLLRAGDVVVVNDTKVIPARLHGRHGETRMEVTLHKPADEFGDQAGAWRVFAQPARRLRVGHHLRFGDDFKAEVLAKNPEGDVTLAFHGMALEDGLARYGEMPLPPYIGRTEGATPADSHQYQTVYAAAPGAVAAPTAGFHFTDNLLSRLTDAGITLVRLTLHVGAGTFLPVRAKNIEHHIMHAEQGILTEDAAKVINRACAAGRRVVAVGSTSLRLLESAADIDGRVRPFAGETDIFISPGYRFRVVDLLLTNFHLPRSTLFILVAAFAGLDVMKAAYKHAKGAGYRFYSYGDATLLQRRDDG